MYTVPAYRSQNSCLTSSSSPVFLSAFANANFPPHHQNACYSNKKSVVTKNQWTASPWQPKCNGHGPLSSWFSSRVTSTHLHRLHTSPLLRWSAAPGRQLIVVVWIFWVDNHRRVSIFFPLTSVAPFNVMSEGGIYLRTTRRFSKINDYQDIGCP